MRDRAVVALEVVLDRDLPVGLDDVLAAVVELEAVQIDAGLRDGVGHDAKGLREGPGFEVDVREDERPPRAHLDGEERVIVRVEPRLALGARRPEEAAVQPIRPRVVGALQCLPVPRALHDDVAAVAADVDEAVEIAVLVPDKDDRDVAGLRGEVVAGLRHLGSYAGVLPRVLEDPLPLERENRAVRVPARGECVAGFEPLADLAEHVLSITRGVADQVSSGSQSGSKGFPATPPIMRTSVGVSRAVPARCTSGSRKRSSPAPSSTSSPSQVKRTRPWTTA